MQPSLLQGATRRFAVLVFSSGINPLKSTTRTSCAGRLSPLRTGIWALAGRPVYILRAGSGYLAVVICKSSLTARGQEIRYGSMSGCGYEKFLAGFRLDERFLNIYSAADSFNLMARIGLPPMFQGRNCCEMF